MKSDRLLSILLILQTRERIPAAELAAELEVSARTIYRDIEALSASGVPVYAERGRHGGIALLPGYRTDMTGLTTDEARALFVLAAQGAHAALGLDSALGSALRKVMAALPAPHRPAAELTSRRILIDPGRWLTGPRSEVDLDVLHTAVFADQRLRIRYRHGGSPEQHTYTVDPYGLVSKAGVWYLVADRQRRPALFRADRIGAAQLVEAPVRRRPGVELADAWEALRRRVEERPRAAEVTVRVHRTRFDMFARIVGPMFADAPDTDVEGDWITVRVAYSVLPAISQLLQFGTSVEVLEPPEARQEMARRAAGVTALYETGETPEVAPLYDGWD
ncbi:YafY family transcriptional regulator [Streptomyces sp. NBC_01795]|uniref:helix-turn-helix transcriptional regulator n=1 Tax=unclassified Streptomyces TaxID=2593676 RepID=UPI002DDA32B8|nr:MULTISPECIES: YafY family protein [unclassified Streptomyces]WSA93712.1 YafY family transcriptional regulator [Streptomyces sp. NBC_01795]WSS13664.1 YafY family transcriptional regulator [Streptomyces sp. NBC_01186]